MLEFPSNVTLRNSNAVHQVSNVAYAWRIGTINSADAMAKIDEIVKEWREDLY